MKFYPLVLILGIEMISLSLLGMVGYAFRQKRSLEVSIKYTLLSAETPPSCCSYGAGDTRTLHLLFTGIGQTLNDGMLAQPVLLAGFGMMIVGVGFKLLLSPFHPWTPDVYQGALVSTFLATASKITIFAVVMRLFLCAPVTNNEVVRLALAIMSLRLNAVRQPESNRCWGLFVHCSSWPFVGRINRGTGPHTGAGNRRHLSGGLCVRKPCGVRRSQLDVQSPYRRRFGFTVFLPQSVWHKPLLLSVLTVMMLSLAGITMTLGFISSSTSSRST
ncbi:MAG: NADH-quinone oxidoreductase subunit N [Sodalis sp.]|nr:MAG: NADH-quinone oxidoreductase subunit N [Sodalis sp.]